MKKDLFNECFDERLPPAAFKQVFCARCRNPTCSLAGWATDQFGARNALQEERLYNPSVGHPDNPRYGHLKEQDFPSLFHKAVRLEVADQRGDWSLPESNVVLAPIDPETASMESQDSVEEAVRSLKQENDREAISDEVVEQEVEEAIPHSEGEFRDQEDQDHDEPSEFQDAEIIESRTPENVKTEKISAQPAKAPVQRQQTANQKNTDFEEGLMLEGASEINVEEKTKKQRVQDSWKPSKVIEPGSTINMGKKK